MNINAYDRLTGKTRAQYIRSSQDFILIIKVRRNFLVKISSLFLLCLFGARVSCRHAGRHLSAPGAEQVSPVRVTFNEIITFQIQIQLMDFIIL